MTQDQGIARGEGGDWTLAADELCRAVEKRVEATARKAAESLYEALLYDTQDYLRDNVNYDLKAEIEAARGEATRCREALARVAKALGLSVANYYGVTADEIIAEFERLDALVIHLRTATLTRGSTDER